MRKLSDMPASFEDLELVPEGKNGEIVGGELFVSPRPSPRYAAAGAVLQIEIGGPFHRGKGGPGGWWILF